MTAPFDRSVAIRLLRHEADVHAVPGREVRDLGDALLLVDPRDPEPFWNRLEAVRFPSERTAFDQRLAEIRILFASLGRQPHVWLLPPYDTPDDLYDRLVAEGFEDAGPGHLMTATNPATAAAVLARGLPREVSIERHVRPEGRAAIAAADAIVEVLIDAFDVPTERRPGIIRETLASLQDPRFTHYLLRVSGVGAGVARRATFDGLSYLSSIGTTAGARGRGLGRIITATATLDGFAAGSEFVHLGTFTDNVPARSLYERLGFAYVGDAGPDMLLVR